MGSIFLDLKAEERWEDLSWALRKMKNELFSLELPTKESFLFVIGQLEVQTKQEAKMIPFSSTGIRKETSGQLFLWTWCPLTKISSWQFTIFTFAFGRSESK